MTIRAILQSRDVVVQSVGRSHAVREAVIMLAEHRIGAMPVMMGNLVIGIFSERDVLYGLAREGEAVLDRTVGEVMIAPAVTVAPYTPVLEALSLMTRRRIRHLPVVVQGELVGFVSIGDLVKYRIDRIEAEANSLRDYIQSA